MNEKKVVELEIWADSFKEGEFILDRIKKAFPGQEIVYKHGFVPTLKITVASMTINFIVYGYYDSWEDTPTIISSQLEYGKPDGIIYDPIKEKIIFAYEETAAVPTGNQSIQRSERTWYAAYKKIPFVYLLGKFGMHIDQRNRKVNIWPAYLGLKLSTAYRIPSLTLLYGNENEPEDYDSGNSMSQLEKLIAWYLKDHINQNPKQSDLENILKNIYKEMCTFIKNNYKKISKNLPGVNQLDEDDFHEYLKNTVITQVENKKFSNDFKWPLSFEAKNIEEKSFDNFIAEIESLMGQQKAWHPTEGSTIRYKPNEKVKKWIEDQTKKKEKLEEKSGIKKETSILFESFPDKVDDAGKKRIATTEKILTLVDSTNDFLDSIENVFGQKIRKSIESTLNLDMPTVLYVTNSIISNGRAFKGDPYTGQLTAFTRIFGRGLNGEKQRNMVAYYPNQLHSQFFVKNFEKPDAKGVKIVEHNVDLILTRDGIAINPETWSLL